MNETRLGDTRAALAPLVRLAFPIALQVLMQTLLNLIDTVMVGQLGEVQIASIALGNQIYFLLILFLFGVGSGSAVFASQYWGAGDVAGVHRSMGLALAIGLAGAAVFTVGAVFFPARVLSVFTTDAAVIREGTGYLRAVGPSYLFTAVTLGFTHGLRSVGQTRLPMYATALSIALNVVGNYVLIFGVWRFPALGVTGAAVATAAARAVEMALILIVIYRGRGPIAASLRQLTAWNRAFLATFVRRASPVVANEILWSTGFTMYTVVFARMGTEFLAAYNIADTVSRLMLVFFIGTAQASQITIGNAVGAGKVGEARDTGRILMRIVPIVSALVGMVVFFAVAPLVPAAFAVSPQVRVLIRQCLRLFAILLVAKVINIHLIVGILRGGADTRFALMIDILPLWFIGVPAAML
ncbi:MAG: MATE family efflux transporter, partial [Cytophagales bacterium]|nr:MATE family efflux transporter [Cytophagales bacterium]